MKDEIKQPCIFFESLLEEDKSTILKQKFISSFQEEYRSLHVKSVDENKGIVEFYIGYTDEITNKFICEIQVHDFYKSFNSDIEENFHIAKSKINELILEATLKDISPERFIDNQILLLQDLLLKTDTLYIEFPKIKTSIQLLIKHLQEKKTHALADPFTPDLITPDDYSTDSFHWDSFNAEETKPVLKKLYSLLTTSPPLIECSETDFINAFTMRKVTHGIKWLVSGKNNKISKSSLFYFIDRLNDDGYISLVPKNQLNKKTEYLFRDSLGANLKNIRQSRNTATSNPAQRDRIDFILNNLFS